MKILYYNWSPFYDKSNFGGGVNVYQTNLINTLKLDNSNEIFFLSSGTRYNFMDSKISIKEIAATNDKNVRTFELFNSPIIAPAAGLENLDKYLSDDVTYMILREFIYDYGPFDVLHYNNIEGLGVKCLSIKNDCPNMKVIYSIHNYFMFCPNGYLFDAEQSNCYGKSMKCEDCMKRTASEKTFRLFYKIDGICRKMHIEAISPKIKLFGKFIYSHTLRGKLQTIHSQPLQHNYEVFRKKNVDSLNKYVDRVLAVSERVKQIAIYYGINQTKIDCSYIGTKFTDNKTITPNTMNSTQWLTIAYMGFLKKEKGIEFLCDALENLGSGYAERVSFLCYARNKGTAYELKLIERVRNLGEKLRKVEYHDGYTHDQLPMIMKKINVGVVPVLWEDNLPQVAIEFAGSGVAVLSSNLGGAHELSDSEHFIYDASRYSYLTQAIEKLLDHPEWINDYFDKMRPLTSMQDHITKLISYYND